MRWMAGSAAGLEFHCTDMPTLTPKEFWANRRHWRRRDSSAGQGARRLLSCDWPLEGHDSTVGSVRVSI